MRVRAPERRKAQDSWRYTFVFVERKDYDDSLVVCHSWLRYPRGNPDACTKKNTRDHEPAPSSSPRGIMVGVVRCRDPRNMVHIIVVFQAVLVARVWAKPTRFP